MKGLLYFVLIFVVLSGVSAGGSYSKSSISVGKQGNWLPEDPPPEPVRPVYTPPVRTGITEPDASTVWFHDQTGVEIEWRGLPDVLYKIELYHNGTFVVQLSSWLEGVSSFAKQAAVSGSWGSGSGFQVKLIDDTGNEYWSEEFQIFDEIDILTTKSRREVFSDAEKTSVSFSTRGNACDTVNSLRNQ